MKNQIAWFKTTKGRHAGSIKVEVFFAVREDGTIKAIDLTRKQSKVIHTFGSKPLSLEVATQQEFDEAEQKQMRM